MTSAAPSVELRYQRARSMQFPPWIRFRQPGAPLLTPALSQNRCRSSWRFLRGALSSVPPLRGNGTAVARFLSPRVCKVVLMEMPRMSHNRDRSRVRRRSLTKELSMSQGSPLRNENGSLATTHFQGSEPMKRCAGLLILVVLLTISLPRASGLSRLAIAQTYRRPPL
jgi:hypothetical protein